jgi:hypothetical protein
MYRFADSLVRSLLDDKLIEVEPGQTDDVVERLADGLTVAKHASLISTITAVLVEDEDVVELYADDEQIKAIVEGMPPDKAGLRG